MMLGATALLLSYVLLSGCAVPPPPTPHTFPADLVGGEIQLLPMPTRLIRAAIDPAGVGHIAAVGEDNQLRHVTITPAGAVVAEVLGTVEKSAKVDIATDGTGAVHILAGSRYLSGTAGHWTEGDAGRCEQLAAAGPDVACAFVVRGGEIEAPLQFGLVLLPGGLPIPLVLPAHKVVFAKAEPTGWRWFAVIEPTTRADVGLTGFIADARGLLHITYEIESFFLTSDIQCRYAIVGMPRVLNAEVEPVTGKNCTPARSLKAIASGSALLRSPFTSTVYIGSPDRAPALKLPSPACNDIEAAGFGGGSFHILSACAPVHLVGSGEATLFYTLYAGGSWWTPVPLTAPDDIAFGAENLFRVVDQGTGRALVVVVLANGRLVARWIDATAYAR